MGFDLHPLHDHVSRQLADKLKARRIVVCYDPRREFEPFVAELRGAAVAKDAPVEMPIGHETARTRNQCRVRLD